MSPLWRDRILIGLAPNRLALARLARGWRPQVVDRRIVPVDPDAGETPWQAPLTALQEALPTFAPREADAEVVLSSAFVHYTLVPWSDQLSDEQEEIAYVRHCFTKIYGDKIKRCALRLTTEKSGANRVASAVDQDLLDGLAKTVKEAGPSLRSVQPHLMAAFNQWRPVFKEPASWFAVAESDRLSLALFLHDRWHSLRTLRVDAAWPRELPMILDREHLLAGAADAPRRVYLFAPGTSAITLPADGGWTLHRLAPPPQPGLSPAGEAAFASILGG